MNPKSILAIVTTAVTLAAVGGSAISAQSDKYALKTPSGVAFSDIRGYEDWGLVSSTHTPNDRLKVMLANPTMIKAYRSGIPGNGKPFPDGSKIVKLQWKIKKMAEAPFDANVPDTFAEIFLMEKDSKRFANSGGWGYAVFNYEPATDKFTPTDDATNCGFACHTPVKAKDYIFHSYQKR